MPRLAICQRWMKHYRVPVYDLLGAQPGVELTVHAALADSIAETFDPAAHPFTFVQSETRPTRWPPGGFFEHDAMVRAARDGGFDLVILPWDIHYLPVVERARRRRRRGVRLALWGHGYSKSPGSFRDRVRNGLGRRADAVLVYSHGVARELIDGGRLDASRVFVAQNAIDQAPVQAARGRWLDDPQRLSRFRAEHGLDAGRTAVFVSRLLHENRLDMLVDALALVRRDAPDARLVVIGDGEGRADLEGRIERAGLCRHVIMTGAIFDPDELAPWMLSAALMVYPVNIGLSLLQAYGFGLPVVTSDRRRAHGPEIEALEPGSSGLLYRDGDTADLTARWLALLDDPEERGRMADEALRRATDVFTLPAMVQGFLDLLSITDGERRTGASGGGVRALVKILHVIPTLDHRSGGPAHALSGLARALGEAGHDVRIVVRDLDLDDMALADRAGEAGVRVYAERVHGGDTRNDDRLDPPGGLAGMIDWCDACHIHAVWENILHRAAVGCRRAGTPHIFRPCGMLDPWCLAQGRWKKALYIGLRLRRDLDRCSAIHFTTTRERDLVAPLGFRAPAIVEPNGLDWTEFETPPEVGAFRTRHPALGERPIVLFLGRVHHKKGLDLLVPAFARARAADAALVVAGPDDGGERARIEALARHEGLADRVLFVGMLRAAERIEALRDADLFVLTSRQENFGIAVVEALATGTPVVISDQVNICDEIAEAGVGGVVPLDVGAITAALDAWLADGERRSAAGEQARAFAAERYDWRAIATRWAAHYEALCAGEAARDRADDDRGPGPRAS